MRGDKVTIERIENGYIVYVEKMLTVSSLNTKVFVKDLKELVEYLKEHLEWE